MRILMVENSGRGGLCAYADALCSGLSQSGVDVTFLTSTAHPDNKTGLYKVERRLSPLTSKQVGVSSVYWAADRIYRTTLNILRRNHFAGMGSFDVVHIQGAVLPLLDQLFLKPLARKMPLVVTIHDVEPHYDRFAARRSFIMRNMQIPHRLIVHYQDGKKHLVDNWGIDSNRIDVIPHGIMPLGSDQPVRQAKESLNLPADRRIILIFGSIRPNKGLEILLKSLVIIRRHQPNVLLVIAGELPRGMSFTPYQHIIDELNLSQYVRSFNHFIPDNQVDTFFAASDIVAMPYLKFQSQSGVLMRACAHKQPVVVSDIGAMGEFVSTERIGLVVEPAKPDLLGKAIINVLDNQAKYISSYTPEMETKYNWTNIAELTIKTYEKAIQYFQKK
jgi:glycosyltransferase involved in cell wall biosynthesis